MLTNITYFAYCIDRMHQFFFTNEYCRLDGIVFWHIEVFIFRRQEVAEREVALCLDIAVKIEPEMVFT